MDLVNRQSERYLLEDVEDGAVWPISRDFRETHTSPTLNIIHSGLDSRFNSAPSISFHFRQTGQVVTLIECDSSWHSDDELEMAVLDLIKRIAVLMLRDLFLRDTNNRQNLSVALAIRAQAIMPLPSSQEASVDSNSDYTSTDLEVEIEDIIHDLEVNWDETTIQHFCESVFNERNSYMEFPFPSIPASCAAYFGHCVRQNGDDDGLGGHPSITYYCRWTRRMVTLAVPRLLDLSTIPFPERVIQGAITLLYRNMGGMGEVEAILDEDLFARAQQWANTQFVEEQAM